MGNILLNKKAYIIILFLTMFTQIHSQEIGSDIYCPIELGNLKYDFYYCDSQDTSTKTRNFKCYEYIERANGVYYTFTLERTMNVVIHNVMSSLHGTNIYLIRHEDGNDYKNHIDHVEGERIYNNSDDSHNKQMGYRYKYLKPGKYFVITGFQYYSELGWDDYHREGFHLTTIQGMPSMGIKENEGGADFENAIDIGSFDESFIKSDAVNRKYNISEIFHKFTINSQMDIAIDHCSSDSYETYMELYDENFKLIITVNALDIWGDIDKLLEEGLFEEGTLDNRYYKFAEDCYNLTPLYFKTQLDTGTYYVKSFMEFGFYSDNDDTNLFKITIKGINIESPEEPEREDFGDYILIPEEPKRPQITIKGAVELSEDQNYIARFIPQTPSSESIVGDLNEDNSIKLDTDIASIITIEYFDGLGRHMQTVMRQSSPNKTDLVIHKEYASIDNLSKMWLPVNNGGNGSFVELIKLKDYAYWAYPDEDKPYAKMIYDNSPLNRVIEQYGSGADWHTKERSVKTYYLTNRDDSSTPITNLDLDGISGKDIPNLRDEFLHCSLYQRSSTGTLSKKSNYNAGELYVTLMQDEDNNQFYEFKDKLGQVVLTRQINGGEKHDTYYVYDDFGNLCYVLPPLAVDKLTSYGDDNEIIKQYAYIYKYDHRNRCISKKIPGMDPIFYIYDKADQLIFAQDGEQRKRDSSEWTFTLSDSFQRPVLTGIIVSTAIEVDMWKDSSTAPVIKANYTGASTNMGYTITGYTITPSQIYSTSYYDNYDFKKLAEIGTKGLDFDATKGAEYNKRYGIDTSLIESKGQLTGSITVLFNKEAINYIHSAMYYDDRSRLIQTQSTNHLGGKESEYIEYNFIGQPLSQLHMHKNSSKEVKELHTYTYDHAGRLIDNYHQLNDGQKILLNSNEYDELGRLKNQAKGNEKH